MKNRSKVVPREPSMAFELWQGRPGIRWWRPLGSPHLGLFRSPVSVARERRANSTIARALPLAGGSSWLVSSCFPAVFHRRESLVAPSEEELMWLVFVDFSRLFWSMLEFSHQSPNTELYMVYVSKKKHTKTRKEAGKTSFKVNLWRCDVILKRNGHTDTQPESIPAFILLLLLRSISFLFPFWNGLFAAAIYIRLVRAESNWIDNPSNY